MSYTYDQLKQALQDYTQNTETTFVNNLDDFIRSAEQRIFTTCDLEIFRKNQTGTTTSGNQYLNLPSDYLASFSLSVLNSSSKEFLLQKDVNFVQEFNPNSSTTGTPRFYAMFDTTHFILGPTPDAAYTMELHYYYRPTSLTAGAGSGTTWLSTNAPNAMLYGSLVEAYTFMKGEKDLMDLYNGRFIESLTRIKDLAEARENADAYRRGLPEKVRT
jgi:hypothetical protein|tara:strand:+ start:16561 stop:17208 length:648 start_codon:yes stop_codon:yes gene_type:complete